MTDPAAARSRAAHDSLAEEMREFARGEVNEPVSREQLLDWANEVAALAAARLALQQENEQLKAQLRGMRDFLSGQPRVLPYGGGETASKESTLNLAWAIGYDGAEDSDAWKLLVSRADRTATRAAAAEAAGTLLRQELEALPRYSMVAHGAYGKKTDWVEACFDVKGEWIKARDLADRLARLAPQLIENKENE